MSYAMRLTTHSFLPHWYLRGNSENRIKLYNVAAIKTPFCCC